MKEKLISFTRDDENLEKVEKGCWIILIFWLAVFIIDIMGFKVISMVPAGIRVVLLVFSIIFLILDQALDVLQKKEENIIRKNNIIVLLFSDRHFASEIIIWLVVLSQLHRLPIVNDNILGRICYIVILVIVLLFVPSKISNYFSKKLKE